MKKILCLIDSLGAGGAQRQLVGLTLFLKKKGYDVTIVVYHKDLFYINDLLENKVKYIYMPEAERNSTRLFQIARFIRKSQPNVVISYLDTPNICACFAKLFNKRFKLIVSERNTTQITGRKERIKFNLYRKADYIVPNSYAQEQYIKKTFSFLNSKIVTITNFVDLKHFTPPLHRKRRDIPEIIIAASIWASKNTFGFIDAVSTLKEKGYKFHISWYGLNKDHPVYIQQCQQKIIDLNLSRYIELKDKTQQIKECYQDADYLCLPSFYEGTPNVICEAMACGLPIACSDVCDNSRYVIDGENGYLFNPEDKESISSAIVKILALNDKEYNDFCISSRRIAEQKLSKESFVESYIKLIEQ